MKKRQQATMSASLPERPLISEMSYEELAAWIRTTRAALQKKLARERAYLDRRAARGTHTPLLALTGGAMLLLQLIANTTGMQERTLPGALFYGLAVLRVLVSVSYVYLCRAKTIRFTDLADAAEQSAHPMVQALPAQAQSMQETMHQEHTQKPEQQEVPTQETPATREPLHAVYGKHAESFGDTIEAILAAHTGKPLTVREVADLAGCSTRTADKWMKRLQLPPQGETTKGGV